MTFGMNQMRITNIRNHAKGSFAKLALLCLACCSYVNTSIAEEPPGGKPGKAAGGQPQGGRQGGGGGQQGGGQQGGAGRQQPHQPARAAPPNQNGGQRGNPGQGAGRQNGNAGNQGRSDQPNRIPNNPKGNANNPRNNPRPNNPNLGNPNKGRFAGPNKVAPGTPPHNGVRPPIDHSPSVGNLRKPPSNRIPNENGRGPTPGKGQFTGGDRDLDRNRTNPNSRNNNRPGFNEANERVNRERSRISNQPFTGNTFAYQQHRFNVGPSTYQPSYYRHSGYHGYWNGNRGYGNNGYYGGSGFVQPNGYGYGYGGVYGQGWGLGNSYYGNNIYGNGGYGYGGYSYRPFGWGLGGWGLGSILYNSGYLNYSNPYYVPVASGAVYNYAQPIQVSYTVPISEEGKADSSDVIFDEAVAAFQQEDFEKALQLADQGITKYPDDAVLHELRALVLFAKHDYQQAAATIHSVLAVGPGWDWTTMSGLYSNLNAYNDQLRGLETFVDEHPTDAAAQFLLAYHYVVGGHNEAAATRLTLAIQSQPNDRVAKDLLKMVSAPVPQAELNSNSSPQEPKPEASNPPRTPFTPAMIVGDWTANREDGATFKMNLQSDGKFKWDFIQKNQKPQGFGGEYKLTDHILVLQRSESGSLVAELTFSDPSRMHFKLVGAPEEDPGLEFTR